MCGLVVIMKSPPEVFVAPWSLGHHRQQPVYSIYFPVRSGENTNDYCHRDPMIKNKACIVTSYHKYVSISAFCFHRPKIKKI